MAATLRHEPRGSPDGRREVRAYPLRDDGSLGLPTVLLTVGADHRGPHRGAAGMCVDSDGNLIVCAGGAGSGAGPLVYVLEPSGRVVATHPVPDGAPTNCAFGGADLDRLFVTTDTGQLYQVQDTGRRGAARYP